MASVGATVENLGTALDRHHVDEGAAVDAADAEGHAALEVGHALDALDQARHGADGAASLAVGGAGMGRTAVRGNPEALERKPTRDDHAVLAGLRDQHVLVPLGLGLDAGAGGWAADLLVGDEHEGDRQPRLARPPSARSPARGSRAGIRPSCRRCRDRNSGRHRAAAAAGPSSVPSQMHGVEMRQDEDAGVRRGLASKPREQDIGVAVACPARARYARREPACRQRPDPSSG